MNLRGKSIWPKKAILILFIFILVSPLGILANGDAWGEWDISEWNVSGAWIKKASNLAYIWTAPFPDYTLPNLEGGFSSYLGYIVSAILGVLILLLLTYLMIHLVVAKK